MARSSLFDFTPAERVAIEAVREERPELVAALSERLSAVLQHLGRTCQGLIASEAETDEFLAQFGGEFVCRMMAEIEPWGEDEDLRGTVVELVARYLLAEARTGFVRQVVGVKRN
jgi:hypothetical protein